MRLLTATTEEPLPALGGGFSPVRKAIAKHRRSQDTYVVAEFVRQQWRNVCYGTEISRHIRNVTGGVDVAPELTHVHFSAGQTVLIVRLLPGQLPSDIAEVADRIGFSMGAAEVRIAPFRADFIRVVLRDKHSLTATVPTVAPVRSALDVLSLGLDELGEHVPLDLASAAHVIVQGSTGSGKSVAMYSLLSQLTKAPDVRVTGVDPTGLLLRPWDKRWNDIPRPGLGSRDPFSYVYCLDQCVAEMDKRVAEMPAGRDSVEISEECPVIMVVLEEHPGALRILDNHDSGLGKTYRTLVSRLLAEGRKGAIRVVMLTQRADAAIVGAYERGQASHRISYRVDSVDGLRMLHPDCTPELAANHSSALPGVGLCTIPGRPLVRLRSPYLGYADYCKSLGTTEPVGATKPKRKVLAS